MMNIRSFTRLKVFSILPVLFAVSVFTGCSDTITTQEPLPRGTMVGTATLYRVAKPVTDHSGIKVTLEESGMSTLTDQYGEFRFDDVATSTYTLRYEKEGYSLIKQPMVSFVGGSIVRVSSTYLYAVPKCGSIFDDIRQIDTSYIEAFAHAACSELDSNIAFFNDHLLFVFSNSPDVGPELDKHQFAMMGQSPQPRGIASVFVSKQQLERYLDLDDSIFVAAFNTTGNNWVDPLTQRVIYSGHNLERDRTLAFKWHKE